MKESPDFRTCPEWHASAKAYARRTSLTRSSGRYSEARAIRLSNRSKAFSSAHGVFKYILLARRDCPASPTEPRPYRRPTLL